MGWQEKVTAQNCCRALVKPENQPRGVVLAPEYNLLCGRLGC